MANLQENLSEIATLYNEGEYEHIRITTEGLLCAFDSELLNLLKASIEDTKNLNLGNRKNDIWQTCDDHWCTNPERAMNCTNPNRKIFAEELVNTLFKGEEGFEKVLILFWYIHTSAYERWEDSFDYDAIGCILNLGRQVADSAENKIKGTNKNSGLFLKVLSALSIQVHHAAYIENSMICNNAEAFSYHAEKYISYSREMIDMLNKLTGIKQIADDNNWFVRSSETLKAYLGNQVKHHEAIKLVGDLVQIRRKNKNEFDEKWVSLKDYFVNTIKKLESEKNFESASELRAHFICLNSHAKALPKDNLSLINTVGHFQYGFFQGLGLVADEYQNKEDFFNELRDYLLAGHNNDSNERNSEFSKCAVLDNITKDPAPDILESNLGTDHFRNILLTFREIHLRELGTGTGEDGKFIATLTPKLYHYALGVGMLDFEMTISKMGVSEFYALKHIASPDSGQYEFVNEGENEPRMESRLNVIAKKIVEEYSELFDNFTIYLKEIRKKTGQNQLHPEEARAGFRKSGEIEKSFLYRKKEGSGIKPVKAWIEVDQAWFTHFEIYGINSSEGECMNYQMLQQHYEWPGIACYQRADKSSLDDWVGIDFASLHLRNLAQIRAHTGDTFIISGNHSICYLFDDPHFIVLQYGETAKWVFLIRCLLLYSIYQSQKMHGKLRKNSNVLTDSIIHPANHKRSELENIYSDLIHDRAEVQQHRIMTMNILEHAIAIGTSHYSDHGLLLQRSFEETGILDMIQRLQARMDELSDIQEGINAIIQHFTELARKKSQRRIYLVLTILTIISFTQSYDLLFKYNVEKPSIAPKWDFYLIALLILILGAVGFSTFISDSLDSIRKFFHKTTGKILNFIKSSS